MKDHELQLLSALRMAVKDNPDLFSQAIMYMQDGVNQRIQEYKEHALQMEKLAMAFKASESMKQTTKTKEWIDKLITSVSQEGKFFNLKDN